MVPLKSDWDGLYEMWRKVIVQYKAHTVYKGFSNYRKLLENSHLELFLVSHS